MSHFPRKKHPLQFFKDPIERVDEVEELSFALFARLYWKYNKSDAPPSDLIAAK